jgi:hypothetical protein
VFDVPRQDPWPGAVSGRQRRQGRNPAAPAAAAVAKKRQFSALGVRAGQIGRQYARRGDADEQSPVEPGVPALDDAVAGGGIEIQHQASIARRATGVSPFSDMVGAAPQRIMPTFSPA